MLKGAEGILQSMILACMMAKLDGGTRKCPSTFNISLFFLISSIPQKSGASGEWVIQSSSGD